MKPGLEPPPDHYLTKAEAAARLRVTPRTLSKFIASGQLAAIKLRPSKQGRVLIPAAAVDKFLASRTVRAERARSERKSYVADYFRRNGHLPDSLFEDDE